MDRETFREQLLGVMERKDHWAWPAFTSGRVPKALLHFHFEQEYETYVRDFPVMVGWAYVRCPVPEVRRSLAENLYEEETGGLVAGAITGIAGSSAWFDRGFVTYTNEAKADVLGVPQALIAEEGAVSEATARAMAEGALARSLAHLAVAITGIAGPGGGSAGKPVGTVCFAWAG